MNLSVRVLGVAALFCASLAVLHSPSLAQATPDPAKTEIYKRFVDNRIPNPTAAYAAARDYLQKYGKDKDQYVEYLTRWIAVYESQERKMKFSSLINEKKFAEAYGVGAKILADEPDYLRAQIDLGYAGVIAATAKVETYNRTALGYARKAIQSIESGKAPTDWAPFKGKDDTLAYLNYAVGYLTLKNNPNESVDALLKAAQYESDIRKTPSTYYFLAAAYESGPYKIMSVPYQAQYAGKPETAESKAVLEKIYPVVDRIIDAYARAIATAQTIPATVETRKDWLAQMTNYYKFRHNGSDAGIMEFIAGSLRKPLPSKPN